MLEKIISTARRILIDAQQSLSAESAAAIERVYDDIVALKELIAKGLYAVEGDSSLDAVSKKAARRGVFEQAGRKLEAIKANWRSAGPGETLNVKLSGTPAPTTAEDDLLQFLREKEVRDRLSGMTEAQILYIVEQSLHDATDPLLLKAILNSPAGFEPVSKETVKKIQQNLTGKTSPPVAGKPQTPPESASRVEELFSLFKTELDRLRRNELPSRLSHKEDSNGPPFKF
jgi:hypothetical protein